MKTPIIGKDQIVDTYYYNITNIDEEKIFQQYEEKVINSNNIIISIFTMDLTSHTLKKRRKEIDEQWKKKLPNLQHIKRLELLRSVDQDYFEAICKMENLEDLNICTSTVIDISSVKKLKNLKVLSLCNFSKLEDISPLIELKSLEILSIEASFKVTNYELIGKMSWLKSLILGGDTFAPRNLMLQSLQPFTQLCELIHLDMSTTSIRDKNYRPILELKKLTRLDAHWRLKNQERVFIQKEHPSLKSGFFVVYDFETNEFKEGVEWWVNKE